MTASGAAPVSSRRRRIGGESCAAASALRPLPAPTPLVMICKASPSRGASKSPSKPSPSARTATSPAASVKSRARSVRGGGLQPRDDFADGLKLVGRALALLHPLLEESGIEFETVQLVFKVVHDLHG